MPIGVQTPITSHTGNGTATVFAYDFAILSADDIKVKVGGSIVATGFTVAGIGDRDGGTVTFSSAPGSGVEVLLYREVSRERTTDYQYAGDLREDVLDDDLDRIVMALQEDAELIARGIRVPVGESLAELPDAASRENKVLTFGDGGAIALLDLADLLGGGGSITIIPADGSVTLVKLDASTQALINGALQRSGGTMTGKITLDGNAVDALHAVPKQQAESIADAASSAAITAARASTANVTAEQNADTFISPDRLKFAKAAVKAWVNFDGTASIGAITPRSSYGVTSVTKNASGDFTVAPNTQADALGAFFVSVGSGGTGAFYTLNSAAAAPTTTTRRFQIGDISGVPSNPGYIFCALVGA